jgi:hypothetical protein
MFLSLKNRRYIKYCLKLRYLSLKVDKYYKVNKRKFMKNVKSGSTICCDVTWSK